MSSREGSREVASATERKLAKLAIAAELIPAGKVKACLAQQKKLAASGRPMPLGSLFVRHELLTPAQLAQLMRQLHALSDVAGASQAANVETGGDATRPSTRSGRQTGSQGGSLRGRLEARRRGGTTEQQPVPPLPEIDDAPAPPADRPPAIIDGYEIVRELGRGGMGRVYEVREPGTGRPLALKLIHPAHLQSVAVRRLRREGAAIASLDHPNLIRVHRLGQVDVPDQPLQPYLVMDRLSGPTLDVHCAGLALRPRVELLTDVALGMAHAHAAGIVHRDLKPTNVLMNAGRPIVTDFGLARVAGATTQLTQTGAVLGSPLYMSPEQVRGASREVDARSDVWALGVMLYELLCDRRPFEGEDSPQLFFQIMQREPDLPRAADTRRAAVELEAICLKALGKEPASRFADAGELAAELQRWLAGEPVRTRPPGLVGTLKRRRGWLAVAAATLLVAGLVLGVRVREGRRLERLRSRAREAAGTARWPDVLATARAVLDARPDDAEMGRLVGRAEAAQAAAAQQLADREAAAQAAAQLKRRLDEIGARVHRLLGQRYVAAIDYPAALAEVRGLLDKLTPLTDDARHASQPRLWELLGIGWFHLGHPARARAALERAAGLPSAGGRVRFYLGRLALREVFEQLLAANPRRKTTVQRIAAVSAAQEAARWLSGSLEDIRPLDRCLASAYAAAASGRADALRRLCDEGLATYADVTGSEELRVLRGLVLPLPERLSDLDLAVRACPHSVWYRVMRASAREASGDEIGALSDLQTAIALDPRNRAARINRSSLRTRRKDWDGAETDVAEGLRAWPDEPRLLHNRALIHLGRGRTALALADLDRALTAAPRQAESFVARGGIRHRAGDIEAAGRDFKAALAADPDDPELLMHLGAFFRKTGDLRGALRAYDRAIELEPRHGEAYNNRAVTRVMLDQPALAIVDARRAIELLPGNPQPLYNLGLAQTGAGRHADAVASYTRALTLAPRERARRIFVARAQARRALGDADGALADLKAADARGGEGAESQYIAGARHEEAKRWSQAEAAYTRALTLDPNHHRARYGRATVRRMLKRSKDALADINALLRRLPDDVDSLLIRGTLRREAGDLAGALADLKRAVDLDPRHYATWLNYAIVLSIAGKVEPARHAWKTTRELAPPEGRARVARLEKKYFKP